MLFPPLRSGAPAGRAVRLRSAGRGPDHSRPEGMAAELGRRPADRKGDRPPGATAGSEDIARRMACAKQETLGRRPADRKADWPPAAPLGPRTSRAGWRAQNKNLNASSWHPRFRPGPPRPNPRSRPGPPKPRPSPPHGPPRALRFWLAPAARPVPRGGGSRRTFLPGFRPGCVRTRGDRQ